MDRRGEQTNRDGLTKEIPKVRLYNSSNVSDDVLRPLLEFAGKGVRLDKTEVHFRTQARSGFGGFASGPGYSGWKRVRKCDTSLYVVSLNVLTPEAYTARVDRGRQKLVSKKFPDGMPLERWEDMLVYLAAHEFVHIGQFRRGVDKGQRIEYRATIAGYRKVNKYREATGREPIPEAKQPNPFAHAGCPRADLSVSPPAVVEVPNQLGVWANALASAMFPKENRS